MAENRMPIVGRSAEACWSGAWGGFGIVPGFAAAKAYASWIVDGDDTQLRVFEALQPKFLGPSLCPISPTGNFDLPGREAS